jgi:sporulation protein YlmC with PRC-barrel domain
MSTAIVGLAALPGFAIAQSDQADDTMTQEQTETDSQTGTGTGVEAETGAETGSDMDGDSSMDGTTGTDDGGSSDMGSGSDDMTSDDMTSGDKPGVSEGHSEVDASTVEASEVEGAPVMSRDGDKLADVSEVLLTEDGSIEAIVVNVGGFLGIGSKPVEVPFDKVTLQTNDEDGEMSIIIPMTEQDLKDMPRYEEG